MKNQNQILVENQKLLLEQIKILNEKVNNNMKNNLIRECPRCDGKGKVPKILIYDSDNKAWSYLEKYESKSGLGNIKYHYNYLLDECPLCRGNKSVDITKYSRCTGCLKICGYNKAKGFFSNSNKYEFCQTCNGLGYL